MIKWNDRFSVGIPEIDKQHKHLVELINKLSEAMKEGRSKDVLGHTLNGLIAYAQQHFDTEEYLFQEHDYHLADAHKAKHTEFVNKIAEFNVKFSQGSTSVSIQLINFLSNWLLTHIKEEDQQYAKFFAEHQAPCVVG